MSFLRNTSCRQIVGRMLLPALMTLNAFGSNAALGQDYLPGIVPTAPQGAPLPPRYSPMPQTQVNIPWYQKLAVKRHHDFGVVPTASKQQHIFEFQNTTANDIVLGSVRASCGCTKPSILTPIVGPGQTARVAAEFDTLKFHGEKAATVTVSVKRMSQFVDAAELQFSVKGRIRRDVVLHPGEVAFGTSLLGQPLGKTVAVSYAGDPTWKIESIKSTNPYIHAVATETLRDTTKRIVQYSLQVDLLADHPLGNINEYLTIQTNDARTTGMPVHVLGRIRKGIEVAPIRLAAVPHDQPVTKRLLLKSDAPVEIAAIRASEDGFTFGTPIGSKKVHVIDYTYVGREPGDVNATITLLTNSLVQPKIDVDFSARVVAQTAAAN